MKHTALHPWPKTAWCLPPAQDAGLVCQREAVCEREKTPSDPPCPHGCLEAMSTPVMGAGRAPLSARPGKPRRDDTEEKSHGTANIVRAFAPCMGHRDTQGTAQRTQVDGAYCLRALVEQHDPHVDKIRRVLDHRHTQTQASLEEAFDPPEAQSSAAQCEIHSPPKHGSWLPRADMALRHRGRPCLGGRSATQAPLVNKVHAWTATRNEKHAKAHGQFTTDDARVKLRRLYPIVSV
jgi:hypothetical protein